MAGSIGTPARSGETVLRRVDGVADTLAAEVGMNRSMWLSWIPGLSRRGAEDSHRDRAHRVFPGRSLYPHHSSRLGARETPSRKDVAERLRCQPVRAGERPCRRSAERPRRNVVEFLTSGPPSFCRSARYERHTPFSESGSGSVSAARRSMSREIAKVINPQEA